jgi:non-lysosomal glucosylceramidase
VAAHMIYEGMIEEGYAVIKGARDRYDGVPREPIPRNPWNEIECGGHYARAMSSWSLLLAASGYEYDGPASSLRFTPRVTPADFRSFFCGPEGWGTLHQTRDGNAQRNRVVVTEGKLAITTIRLATQGKPREAKVSVAGDAVAARLQADEQGVLITLTNAVVIASGQVLEVSLT